MPLNLFYTMVQKSQKWPKTQIKGGPALKARFRFPGKRLWLAEGCWHMLLEAIWDGVWRDWACSVPRGGSCRCISRFASQPTKVVR